MNIQMKILLVVFALAGSVYAGVIGNFEGVPDGCIDWGNQLSVADPNNMPSKYNYDTAGATLGTQSLRLQHTGWQQTLAFRLSYDQRVEFMANDQFIIDITVPANHINDGSGGWTEVLEITLNADGYGWNAQSGTGLFFGFWDNSPEQTGTIVMDYSAAKASMPAEPGFIEIVFTTNNDGVHDTLYFDNAQLSTPVPYADEVMADEPVLYLKFDTLTAEDSSGNNYWVGYQAGASVVISADSIGGGAIHLDGSSGGSVAATNQAGAPSWGDVYGDEYAFAPDDITFEFWTKIESMTTYGMFFQQIGTWENENQAPGFGQADPSLRILNGTRDETDDDFWYPGLDTPSDGEWHHMVVAYDEQYGGDPNSMGIQLYIDGSLVNSAVYTDPNSGVGLGPELDHIVIGGENNRGYVYNTFIGMVDEFAIYAGVLSSDRIAAHYASGINERDPKTCADVWEKGFGLPGDADKDCDVDLYDFSLLYSDWLLCNDPNSSDPACVINW